MPMPGTSSSFQSKNGISKTTLKVIGGIKESNLMEVAPTAPLVAVVRAQLHQ
jgi:hypothetical protein